MYWKICVSHLDGNLAYLSIPVRVTVKCTLEDYLVIIKQNYFTQMA